MRLQTKLILLICSLIFVIISIFGIYLEHMETQIMKNEIGTRALAVAETVAQIPEIKNAFDDPEPWIVIQPIVEEIRVKTDAEYIVVGNREGIRFSHPVPDRIGKEMVGGDNGPVLQGHSIISEAVGSLGPSLRGKAPIFGAQGQVIGIVSVGMMQEDIAARTAPYQKKIIWLIQLSFGIGVIGALLISTGVKRAILGLEPREIGRLYREKQAVLESIREGIIAVNQAGNVTMVNQTAARMFGFAEGGEVVGSYILDVLPGSRLLEVVQSGQSEYDQEMIGVDDALIVNRVPVVDHRGHVIGAVASFRSKTELYKVTEELSQVKRYAESLRAQTHEFSNKLYMISGLIQLESYQEALELITRESDVHQNLVQFIMQQVPDPMIGGLLIGKFNRAQELKVELKLDPHSSFVDVPLSLDRSHFVTILGNLLENAMEAVLGEESTEKQVRVLLTDLGDDCILEVEDTGPGVPEAVLASMFDVGVSTKAEQHRGFGLALVKRAVEQLGGYITYTALQPRGSLFTVAIPKRKAGRGDGA
ncbi:sensor histidine kinase [Tumebacillus sp. ITR2]|uniref:histidine kinase n=1 Tax=Tumebacillus amylolyticus TaxID=2801339 RepID=A0ABS1J8Q8_9BACL|nr:sensor histidine kinase [Tumebacillus amylolyticus]MBL0386449.1 sensor histidine kinase [Tumebacillus amylolyticus]